MLYSSAGFLAAIVHLIINHDVLWKYRSERLIPARRSYRAFLLAVLVYYISDILWGILYEHKLITLTVLDTEIYFIAMACSILLWTRYTVEYLRAGRFGRLLKAAGWFFFGVQILVLIINLFVPVLFVFDAQQEYHALGARYVTLAIQIGLFLATAGYAAVSSGNRSGTMKFRLRIIGLYSLAMAGFTIAQFFFPLLPMYSIGCMLGSCLLHSFVLENEKDDYREDLEAKLEESVRKGNYYDLLTGLPGMTYFFELMARKRKKMKEAGQTPAFLFLDLSGMKFFNYRRGFAEGDRLLQSFARLMTKEFGEENCSRFGQDHFVAVTESDGVEEKLNQLFREWEKQEIQDRPAVRAGIYLEGSEETDISVACDRAKAARDAIRNSYLSTMRYFDGSMLENAERKQYIISHFEKALAEKWIQVYYQPIIRANNGRVCDEEALARWFDPERGLLSPGEFIPILEEANLIYRLDLYIVEQVLEKNRQLEKAGLSLVPQSINLSRADFDSCDIVEEIRKRVDQAGFPRRLFSIEITESIIGSDLDFIGKQIERFRGMGFRVWMDDFGSGYSSLDVLSSIQVDLIKLDMRFMQQFDHGDKSKIILTELMKLAIGLEIDTVCEGVEREDQVEFLRDIGCDKLQGYYYARPMPVGQILERYEKGIQIGFENPEETEYFDAVGRINLYDLSVFAKEEEAAFRHYFSTVPMAVVEEKDGRSRMIRCNQSCLEFLQRSFQIASSSSELTGEIPESFSRPLSAMLRKCRAEGGRALYDEEITDGRTVHFFIRHISDNPQTGAKAAAVAVLAVTETTS